MEQGDAQRASDRLREALAMWRGPPFADFAYEPFAQSETARLEEERLAAGEERVDADLALGKDAELVGELEGLVRDHPLRERVQAQLMLALYRSGRQADALERYQEARRALVDQLGIEPGRELQELERAILNQDSALGGPRRRVAPPGSRRRVLLLAVGGALLLAAAAALELGAHRGIAALASASADSVALISPAGAQLQASFPVGGNPGSLAAAAGALWALNADDRTVTRIDLESHAMRTYGTDGIPVALAAGDGSLWVIKGAQPVGSPFDPLAMPESVSRLDPVTASLVATIPISQPVPSAPRPLYDLAVSPQGVWVANVDGSVLRIEPASNRVVQTIPNLQALAIASGAEGTWVLRGGRNASVVRLSPDSNRVAQRSEIPAVSLSGAIAVGGGAVWLTDPRGGELWRVEPGRTPDDPPVERTIRLAPGVSDVAYGAGAVWVANRLTGTVSRVDPQTNRVTQTIPVGNTPGRLTVGGGGVWVAVAKTSGLTADTSVPTGATIGALLQQRGCPRAPVLWTGVKSVCVY